MIAMKKTVLSTLILLTSFSFLSNAQGGKYGEDSVTCVMNISLFNEYYKQKNYNDAVGPWRWVFNNCPKGTKRTYLYGENMYESFIESAEDPAIKAALVDTLMMIFDKRIEHYGEEGYVLGKKGVSLYNYYPDKKEDVSDILARAVEIEGTETGPVVIYRYFQVNTELYSDGKRTKEQILDIYDQCSEVVDANMEGKDSANYARAQQNLETFFGPFASCEDLENIYKPRLESAHDDADLQRKIVNLFGKKGCNDSPIYLEAAEKLYKTNPVSRSAASLARLYAGKGMSSKASQYYSEAIDLESDQNKKARYLMEMADLSYRKMKNYQMARTYALRAIAITPNWGKPYILLGDIYVAGSGTCGDDFENLTVFWVAVDKYQKAKTVDPAYAQEANGKINTYSKYFPKKDDVFFRGMQPGDSHKVGCWVNETTTVKVK